MGGVLMSVEEATALRKRAQAELRAAEHVEAAVKLSALASALQEEAGRLARHDLVLAASTDVESRPRLYLIKRDHSGWVKLWWCVDKYWLDAEQGTEKGYRRVMDRPLTGDVEMARRALFEIIERGQLVLGNFYLPGELKEVTGPVRRLERAPMWVERSAVASPGKSSEGLVRMGGDNEKREAVVEKQSSGRWWRKGGV